MADLIDRWALLKELATHFNKMIDGKTLYHPSMALAMRDVRAAPAVDAVEVSEIKAYLQRKLDEWNALGDRKFEPANMWGYNFIMACFDDLSSYGERRADDAAD